MNSSFRGPIKLDYLAGRFLAGLGISFVAFLAVPLGMIIGSLHACWIPSRLGPFMPRAYLYGPWLIALPNLFLFGSYLFRLFQPFPAACFTPTSESWVSLAAYSSSMMLVRDIEPGRARLF